LYFVGIENCFGKVMHSGNLYVIGAMILACSRADDALSVKAWLAKRRGIAEPAPSGEYRWPVRAIWLTIAAMYCAAGVSKLTHTGWEWAWSESFRNLLLSHHYTREPITPWGLWLAQYPQLCRWVATGSLVLELTGPLLLLGGYFTLVFGGGLMSLQLGIFLMLGVKFDTMLPVFLALVPWTWLFIHGKRLIRPNLEKGSQVKLTEVAMRHPWVFRCFTDHAVLRSDIPKALRQRRY
jgi:hypothetical protein